MQDNALDPGTVRVRWVSLALSGAADQERWQAVLDRRGPLFARLWTLKEAFVKATGEGLRRSLADFSFTLDPITIRFHGASQTGGRDWQFAQLCLDHEQVIAIAVRRPAAQPIVLDAKEIYSCQF